MIFRNFYNSTVLLKQGYCCERNKEQKLFSNRRMLLSKNCVFNMYHI